MRIAVDARLAGYRRGGISTYAVQLISALAALDLPFELVAVLSKRDPGRWLPPGVGVMQSMTPPHHRVEPWLLALELLRLRAALFHATDFIPPRGTVPAVITVHDLAFLRWPQLLTREAAAYYGQIHRAVRQARAIIAVSQATRRDLLELTKADPDRIEVIYEAADPLFRPLSAQELSELEDDLRARGRLGTVPSTYAQVVLTVATLEPRKDLPTLINAFSMLSSHGDSPQLWVAGARGWLDQEIFRCLRESPAAPRVLLLGEVSPEELLWLYNRATLVAQPSLYEGFGLPAVEAMACGRPLLASSAPALSEVVADGGLLLPPGAPEAWAASMEALLADTAAQAELSRRALARSRAFSWRKAAEQTLQVYRRALQV